MSSSELKSELHRIIERIDDNRVLQAVHTLLEGQDTVFLAADKKQLRKEEMDLMLQEGEADINAGQVIDQKQLLEEIKTWRKK